MITPQILILTAIQTEAKPIACILGLARQGDVWLNREATICLRMIGIGGRRLPAIEPSAAPKFIILAGLAGALNPQLKVGEIVLDECPDSLKTGFSGHLGRIHSADRLATTPKAKADLFASTGAMAVEMEAHVVRPWVSQLSSAFIHIRAISDSASEELNPRLLRLVDEFGRVKVKVIATELIRRPAVLPELLHLAASGRKSTGALAKAVKWMVNYIQA